MRITRILLTNVLAAAFFPLLPASTSHAIRLFTSSFEVFDPDASTQDILVRDRNGDGRPDLVICEATRNTIAIFDGGSTPLFQDVRRYPASGPKGLVLHDLDADGIEDGVALTSLRYVGQFADSVLVFKGTLDGGFDPTAILHVDRAFDVRSAAVGDIDADGHADIAISFIPQARDSTISQGSVAFFPGHGDGTFGPQRTLELWAQDPSIDLSDFNGDGYLDLAVITLYAQPGGEDHGLRIWLGDGAFQFVPDRFLIKRRFCSFADVVDLDRDGRQDMVALVVPDPSESWKGEVQIFWGKDGGFEDLPFVVETPEHPVSAATADLDGDGTLDLVVANQDAVTVSLLHGLGGRAFTIEAEAATTIAHPTTIAAADLDVDGIPDLVVGGPSGFALHRGNSAGGYGGHIERHYFDTSPDDHTLADFDADGRLDLVVATPFADEILTLPGRGDGTFGDAIPTAGIGTGPQAVHVLELDGDSRPDLVVGTGSGVSVLGGRGDGSFELRSTHPTRAVWNLASGDLDGDGRVDVVTASSLVGEVRVLLGTSEGGLALVPEPVLFTGRYAWSVALLDLDEDGRDDLVAGTEDTRVGSFSGITTARSLGGGRFQPGRDYSMGGRVLSIAVGDLNGDTRPDLATVLLPHHVAIFINRGDGSLAPEIDYPAPARAASLALADLDRDGDLDIVVVQNDANAVEVLLGHGDGSFELAGQYGTGLDPRSVALGDLNGDRLPDCVTSEWTGRSITVLFNRTVIVPIAVQDLAARWIEEGVELRWRVAAASQARSLRIERAEAELGPFRAVGGSLEPRAEMRWVDRDARPDGAAWYRLQLLDTDGARVAATIQTGPRRATATTWLVTPSLVGTMSPVVLRYGLANRTPMRLDLFDVRGRRVRELLHGAGSASESSLEWDQRDGAGRAVGRGVYFVRLVTSNRSLTRRLLVVRP